MEASQNVGSRILQAANDAATLTAQPTTRITIMAKGNNAHKKEVKKPKKEKPKPAPAGRKS